jgi:hypothetical protein
MAHATSAEAMRDRRAATVIRKDAEGRRAPWTARASLQGRIHGVPSASVGVTAPCGEANLASALFALAPKPAQPTRYAPSDLRIAASVSGA